MSKNAYMYLIVHSLNKRKVRNGNITVKAIKKQHLARNEETKVNK